MRLLCWSCPLITRSYMGTWYRLSCPWNIGQEQISNAVLGIVTWHNEIHTIRHLTKQKLPTNWKILKIIKSCSLEFFCRIFCTLTALMADVQVVTRQKVSCTPFLQQCMVCVIFNWDYPLATVSNFKLSTVGAILVVWTTSSQKPQLSRKLDLTLKSMLQSFRIVWILLYIYVKQMTHFRLGIKVQAEHPIGGGEHSEWGSHWQEGPFDLHALIDMDIDADSATYWVLGACIFCIPRQKRIEFWTCG